MVALKITALASGLASRMRDRLRSSAASPSTKVTWQRSDGQRLLIDLTSLKVRATDGWLLCSLDLQTDQTGKQNLQFVFFLGRPQEADGQRAAGTINAPGSAATRIAAVWGAEIQRVLWDVILDFLEAALWQAGAQQPNQRLTVQGFHCTEGNIHAEVIAGEF